jgi:hypothetical protein
MECSRNGFHPGLVSRRELYNLAFVDLSTHKLGLPESGALYLLDSHLCIIQNHLHQV